MRDIEFTVDLPGYGNLNHLASDRTPILASVRALNVGCFGSDENPPAAVTIAQTIHDTMIARIIW